MYAYDLRSDDDLITLFQDIAESSKITKDVLAYSEILLKTACENLKEIDALLQNHTANWEIERMAAVDRNILRLAVAELKYMEDIPFKVVIDEAVEIAKIYGADDSGKFVNGVIDAIYRDTCKI